MSKSQIISLTLAVLLFGSDAQAQSGDWQSVESLARGTQISVKARQRYMCWVESVTPTELICMKPRSFRRPVPVTIPRDEVREIRLVRNAERDMMVGAGIGAGVGAIAGVSQARNYRGINAFFGALGGALFGMVIGPIVGIFRKDKIIYKQ